MASEQLFVDIHSHVIPSDDDGVRSVEEGMELLRETARRGTLVQFGTPHVTDNHPLTAKRRRRVEAATEQMAAQAAEFGLRLQLGWELSPLRMILDLDPADLRLGDLPACLLELPLPHTRAPSLQLFEECVRHIESAGLTPVLAHPERSDIVQQRRELLRPLAASGRLLQVNGDSLLGRNGDAAREVAWWIVDEGLCHLVGSDGHRASRPPYLDGAFKAVAGRIGEDAARPLFDGSALERLPAQAAGPR
jgi:protein-tyrosine phosphatase